MGGEMNGYQEKRRGARTGTNTTIIMQSNSNSNDNNARTGELNVIGITIQECLEYDFIWAHSEYDCVSLLPSWT